ncbi:MAG: hypothetical protein BWX78_01225 [Firmicutes bacterium ADurb.Bin099]|nr:MAG: hypothetical protein BWX78_01225 [Firmicutes bacterium ADurb.Bin099]
MEISKSSKLYLENYYVLEQARTEAHQYLRKIIDEVSEFENYVKENDSGDFRFTIWVRKDGGRIEFISEQEKPLPGISSVDKLNLYLIYLDALKEKNLSSSTKYVVSLYTPKTKYDIQNSKLQDMNTKLKLPDLFRSTEFELLKTYEKKKENIRISCILYNILVSSLESTYLIKTT